MQQESQGAGMITTSLSEEFSNVFEEMTNEFGVVEGFTLYVLKEGVLNIEKPTASLIEGTDIYKNIKAIQSELRVYEKESQPIVYSKNRLHIPVQGNVLPEDIPIGSFFIKNIDGSTWRVISFIEKISVNGVTIGYRVTVKG